MTVHCHSQRNDFFLLCKSEGKRAVCVPQLVGVGGSGTEGESLKLRPLRLADGGLCMSTEQYQNGGGEHESDERRS